MEQILLFWDRIYLLLYHHHLQMGFIPQAYTIQGDQRGLILQASSQMTLTQTPQLDLLRQLAQE